MPTSISSIPKCLPGLSTASRAPCAWFSIGRASAATISWPGSRPRPGRRAPAACLAARRATGSASASTSTPCPRPRPRRRFSVENLRLCCRHARHVADPDGFDRDCEEDFERRWLQVDPMLDGMHSVDGVLDPVTGAAFRTALDALALWRGPEDTRNHGQRMTDALAELLDHHMNEGRLPRRKGVRPHVTLTTTLEGLKDELGQPAAELELGLPISGKTVERLACDCTMSRVLMADSVVVDVGRATRSVSPATRRALQVRDRGCRWPGCDRPG